MRAIASTRCASSSAAGARSCPRRSCLVEMSDLTESDKREHGGNGTGPYKVPNFVPDQRLTLVPNNRTIGPKACLERRSRSCASPTRRRW